MGVLGDFDRPRISETSSLEYSLITLDHSTSSRERSWRSSRCPVLDMVIGHQPIDGVTWL